MTPCIAENCILTQWTCWLCSTTVISSIASRNKEISVSKSVQVMQQNLSPWWKWYSIIYSLYHDHWELVKRKSHSGCDVCKRKDVLLVDCRAPSAILALFSFTQFHWATGSALLSSWFPVLNRKWDTQLIELAQRGYKSPKSHLLLPLSPWLPDYHTNLPTGTSIPGTLIPENPISPGSDSS